MSSEVRDLAEFRAANPRFFETIFLPHYCSTPYLAVGLRGASREWRACIGMPERMSARRLLKRAAEAGDVTLCDLAFARGARDAQLMLEYGARGGWEHICLRACAMLDDDPDLLMALAKMADKAASRGHRSVCELARRLYDELCDKTGADSHGYRVKYDFTRGMHDEHANNVSIVSRADEYYLLFASMMHGALKSGHDDLARLVLEWFDDKVAQESRDARNICGAMPEDIINARSLVLDATVTNNREDFFDAMLARGVHIIPRTLQAAAESGNRKLFDAIDIAIGEEERDWAGVLQYAALHDNIDFFRYVADVAIARNPRVSFEFAAFAAAARGYASICSAIREYVTRNGGPDISSTLFTNAAGSKNVELCRALWIDARANVDARAHLLEVAIIRAGWTGSVAMCAAICELARADGIEPSYAQMIRGAALSGKIVRCIRARELAHADDSDYGKSYYGAMFFGAMSFGHDDICLCAMKWMRERNAHAKFASGMLSYIERQPKLARACRDAGYLD